QDLREYIAADGPPTLDFVLGTTTQIVDSVGSLTGYGDAVLGEIRLCIEALRRDVCQVPLILMQEPAVERPADLSPRTLHLTRLAVRLLPPADRARYREEFAAELADLPRCDQAPHAVRLAFRAGHLRRSLTGKPSVRSTRVVMAVGVGS